MPTLYPAADLLLFLSAIPLFEALSIYESRPSSTRKTSSTLLPPFTRHPSPYHSS
ncbi:hypothetical protein ASPTUDRAFT_45076 [Aspergillus tubingensis CBS 134.48]|uniref:Uncharacterized protein n=1 Tax=Aspergillus tubingensis (strain CBS 134.48) TaxID=767770 RepID=A0A1L9MXM3_ASPTC|nr:hypothetical protein ASPTUDRAFT_45076 [Aspergillus tubingensis CBS 134.48]